MMNLNQGRNIFDCIRKFVKFQLTVNLLAMAIAIFGGFVLKESPINAVQMLWINVIMDSFASLALATGPPNDDVLKRPPIKKTEKIITEVMWRAITFQALAQFILLLVVLFFAADWYGIPSSIGVKVFIFDLAIHRS
jgi:Ca2+ transporting ATPase